MSDIEQVFLKAIRAVSDLANAFAGWRAEIDKARMARDALALWKVLPAYRRARMELELGYRVPDWAWRVWEQQAAQLGSGNGQVTAQGDE